jgi:hypothetical protein
MFLDAAQGQTEIHLSEFVDPFNGTVSHHNLATTFIFTQ